MNRGSILLFTMICVLILSLLAAGLLSVGTTEVHTTQNQFLKKTAFYFALEGIEEVREEINQDPTPEVVELIERRLTDTEKMERGITKSYITGTMLHLQNNTQQTIFELEGFDPPPPVGVSSNVKIATVVWDVIITARIEVGKAFKKIAYSEVESGIWSIVPTGY